MLPKLFQKKAHLENGDSCCYRRAVWGLHIVCSPNSWGDQVSRAVGMGCMTRQRHQYWAWMLCSMTLGIAGTTKPWCLCRWKSDVTVTTTPAILRRLQLVPWKELTEGSSLLFPVSSLPGWFWGSLRSCNCLLKVLCMFTMFYPQNSTAMYTWRHSLLSLCPPGSFAAFR